MLNFLGDLLLGVIDFLTDVLLFRHLRRIRGRPQHTFGEDAANLAIIEWIELPLAGLIAVLAGFGMYAFGVPGVWCFVAPGVAVVAFGLYRYRKRRACQIFCVQGSLKLAINLTGERTLSQRCGCVNRSS